MPANPDSLDIVQLEKQESAALGGDAADEVPYAAPIEPIEDAIEVAGVTLVEPGNRNKELFMWRDGDDMRFRDVTNPGTAGGGHTLSEMLASGSGGEVNTASNVGGEVEVFKQKSVYDLEFRTLDEDGGLNISQETDTIKLSTGFRRHFLMMGG